MERPGIVTPEPTFDPTDGVYRLHCDWDALETPALFVVEAIAAVKHCDSLDLEPLQKTVDVDGLETLLRTHEDKAATFSVEFEYEGTVVTLDRSGDVVIEVTSSSK